MATVGDEESHFMPHPIYSEEELEDVKITHQPPKKVSDKVAFGIMSFARRSFDLVTGYGNNMTADKWMTRFLFLESVAGVPGMVGGMARHLHSLRTMKRDHGWIHLLLEEAENERMHLLTFMEVSQPSWFFRAMVLGAQGVFVNMYFLAYLLAPKTCHRFVGYLEEEATKTYTHAIKDVEEGNIPEWTNLPASQLAKKYWRLQEDAKFIDVLKAVRCDEAVHRTVNHTLSDIGIGARNPYRQ